VFCLVWFWSGLCVAISCPFRSSGCGEVSGSEERREEGCFRLQADELVVAAEVVAVSEEKVEESASA
jgi:hypothetical protein